MENRTQNSSFNRLSVENVSWFLHTLGINVSNQENSLLEIIRLIMVSSSSFIVILGTSMYAFVNRNNFDETVKIAAYFGGTSILFIAIPHLFLNKSSIKTLIQRIDKNIFFYPDENDIKVHYSEILSDENTPKLTLMVLSYACFGFTLAALSPFIGFFLTGTYQTTIYPSWHPWREDGPVSKTMTSILQLIVCFGVFWSAYALQMFLAFLAVEFLRQYMRLGVALLTIPTRSSKAMLKQLRESDLNDITDDVAYINYKSARFNNNHRAIYNELCRRNIISCIKHHQELLKLFNLFKPWFVVLFTAELFYSMTTFALVFYNIQKIAGSEAYFLTIIGSSFNVITNLFFRCFIGEVLFGMNNQVMNAIYDTNWVEQSQSNQQLLAIFHQLSKQSHSLKAFSVFPASYETFAGITRLSYSYFNLIRTSVKRA